MKKEEKNKEENIERITKRICQVKGRKTSMEIVECEFEGKRYNREIVHRPSACVAIVEIERDPTDLGERKFIFIEQFRTAIGRTIFEAVAGCIDAGEDENEAIKREIKEETGFNVTWIQYLSSVYSSPGYSDEEIFIYYAKVDPNGEKQNLDEDERVDPKTFSEVEIDFMVADGMINDAKTLLAWMLVKLFYP